MTNTQRLVAESFTYRYVARMFAMFCDPRNRGKKFLWSAFPLMMEKLAANQAYFSFAFNYKKNHEEILDYVEKTAIEFSSKLVAESGLAEPEKKNPKVTATNLKSLREATKRALKEEP